MRYLLSLLWLFTGMANAELPWDLVAQKFLLLDSGGSQEPAKVPGFSYSPFGALVYWDGKTSFGLCSATHVSGDRLLTAAHCLSPSSDLSHYQAIFYDKQGKKQHASVLSAAFKGDEKIDIAVLTIDKKAAEGWEVVGGEVRRYDTRSIAAAVPEQEAVVAWSFTPINSVKNVHDRYPGQLGMVFRPNHCQASRTIPHLEVFSKSAKERKKIYEFYFRKKGITDEKLHVFLDQCVYPVIQGNSGSLISLAGQPKKKVGVLHLFVADKDKIWNDIEKNNQDRAELEYFYLGNDGRSKRFAWGFGEFLIASGSALVSLGNRLDELLGTGP